MNSNMHLFPIILTIMGYGCLAIYLPFLALLLFIWALVYWLVTYADN